MKTTEDTKGLVCLLEQIVGSSCYNPNSYNGWTGEYGRSYRYPVCYKFEHDGQIYEDKTKYGLGSASARGVSGAYYRFGTNLLSIGLALEKVLTFIEDRYDIDFEELEKKHQKNK